MKTLISTSLALLVTLLTQAARGSDFCTAKVDLLIIMDASGSIKAADFPKQLDFASKVVESFQMGPDHAQFAGLLFSTRVKELFCFNTFSTPQDVQNAIMSTSFTGGGTYTAAALAYARTQIYEESACGGRPDAAKVVILMTDGKSRKYFRTLDQAQLLRDSGATVLSIGIGTERRISMPELNGIASREDLAFRTPDFNALTYLRQEVSEYGCLEASPACKVPLDLVFLLDTSRGLGRDNHEIQIEFTVNLANQFLISPTHTRVSVLQFAHKVHKLFCFNQYTDNALVADAIQARKRFFVGTTKMSKALKTVRTKIFVDSCGSRADAAKVLVLVTDGKANSASKARAEADLLKAEGIKIVTVGVGDLDEVELNALASSPTTVFTSPSFVGLEQIKDSVGETSCEVAANDVPGHEEDCTERCAPTLVCKGEPKKCVCEDGFEYEPEVPGCVPLPGYQEECTSGCASNLECQDRGDVKQCGCQEGYEYDSEQELCVQAESCAAKLDAVFLLDASSTIGNFNFQKMIDFAASITTKFNVGPDAIQFSTIVYADQAQVSFCLNAHGSGADLEQAIRGLAFVQGNAQTGEALKLAREQVFIPGCGARPGVPRAAIVVSDGRSAQPANSIAEADLLKQTGVQIIVVGVGFWALPLEMMKIASENQLVYGVHDYDILDAITQEVSTSTCDGTELPGWDETCQDMCASNLQCVDVDGFRCRCADGYFYDVASDACKMLPDNGEPCDSACRATLVCQQGTCGCEDGYEYSAEAGLCEIVDLCEEKLDLVFVLDASVSVGAANFQTELTWVKNLASKFHISADKTQVSMATFSDNANKEFCFSEHGDKVSLLDAISNVPYVYGLTHTGKALHLVRTELLTDACGLRPSVTTVVIVLTDGYSTRPEDTLVEAQLLKQAGVRLISVAVGVNVSNSELEAIASGDELIYQVEDFDDLETIREGLASGACQVIEELPEEGEFCEDQCAETLVCTELGAEKICKCPEGEIYDDKEKKCKPAPGPGEPCITLCKSNLDCLEEETGNTCQCQKDFSWNSDTEKCEVDPGFQEPCTESCLSNLVCEDQGAVKMCECPEDQYFDPRQDKCVDIPGYNDPCTALCDIGLVCQGEEGQKVCQCAEGLEYSAEKGECVLKEACVTPLDLLFVVDSSSSIRRYRFDNKVKPFMQALADSFVIGPDATRVAALTFSIRVRHQFCFNDSMTQEGVHEAIGNINYVRGLTRTDLGLQAAREDYLIPACGARDGAQKMVLVFTDGNSTDTVKTVEQSALLHEHDLTVITVGVGNINKTEMRTIATEPNLVFRVGTFNLLEHIQNRVITAACTAPLLAPGYGETCVNSCRSNLDCHYDAEADSSTCVCPPYTGYDHLNVVCT